MFAEILQRNAIQSTRRNRSTFTATHIDSHPRFPHKPHRPPPPATTKSIPCSSSDPVPPPCRHRNRTGIAPPHSEFHPLSYTPPRAPSSRRFQTTTPA